MSTEKTFSYVTCILNFFDELQLQWWFEENSTCDEKVLTYDEEEPLYILGN